ncbi:TIGR00341 family protein [Sphingomonas xanthus]|uniref:TIGR00341 family protein n=1 Tax=Sphingomonas xanthus TaxID=2594473 RepID=A0A516IQU4_9SPHN|nr:TIGR00341 family protein [Sphingomonas xanthus]QDP19288.1 TIGR00341 family protein [Sphingomonas xanthus]
MSSLPEDVHTTPTTFSQYSRLRMMAGARRLWRREVVASVDQWDVLTKVAGDTDTSARYLYLCLLSAGIAVLGLLQSSPAVVIGAMLLSPLMSPIVGAGLAISVGDIAWLRQCSRTLLLGMLVAVFFSALIVLLSPIQTVTEEIAARTRPNLFDLLVALFSGLAGAYATIRGREGAIVGVAIATALMPPLAVIGFGMATSNLTVFGGALLLLITNLMTIALSAAVVARFYGFSTSLTKKQSRFQVIGIIAAFLILAIPLGYSLRQIAWELRTSVDARRQLADAFPKNSRLSQVDIDYDAEPLSITASILTPMLNAKAEQQVANKLTRSLGLPVAVHIDQFKVGTDAAAAEQAALASARSAEQAEAQRRDVARLTDRIALVAGANPDEIVIDRERRVALARVRPIPGASYATYRELERRIVEESPRWSVRLRPPIMPLPRLRLLDDGQPDPASVALIGWAARRVGTPIEISGDEEAAERLRETLATMGVIDVTVESRTGRALGVRWLTDEDAAG